MGRPTSEFYRRIAVGTLDRYTGKDHRVTRDVIGWLAAGTESTRTGVMRIHTGAIADDLGWPRGQIEAAIHRLASDGLAVWSPAVRVIACAFVVDVLAVFTENHRKSYLNHLDTLPQCDATEYARKVIQAIEITRGEGASNAPYNAPLHGASNRASNGAIRDKGEGKREKGEGNKTPIGVIVPADADTDRPTGEQSGQHLAPTQPEPAGQPFLLAPDHTPAQAQKRQPQGQPDGKTAKRPRTVAEQKPTSEQTRAYFASQNAPASEADACLDYWQAQGFRRKAGPILDWEATCRTWIRNWRDRGSQTTTHSYGKRAPLVAPIRTEEEVAASIAKQNEEWERCEREGRSYW